MIDEEYPGPRIISERDILNSLGRGEDPDSERVGDHMSDTLIAAAPDWSLERAAMEMSRRHIRHLVVVEAGELVGILSMRDIVRVWTTRGRDLRHDLAGVRGVRRLGVRLGICVGLGISLGRAAGPPAAPRR